MSERDTYREPDSNPETTTLGPSPPDFDRDDTRSRRQRDGVIGEIASKLERVETALAEERGARSVWRTMGGVAAMLALGLGGAALSLAMNASADHERVGRHDQIIEALREDVTAIRVDVSAVRARVEHRSEKRSP